MIVYLLVHLPSEMSYVGSTELTAEKRFAKHWNNRRDPNKQSRLLERMRESRKSDWLVVTLEQCWDVASMLESENFWMFYLDTLRPRVGFNERPVSLGEMVAKQRPRSGATWSPEQLERFRQDGLKGAAVSAERRSSEQRRADAWRGGEATRQAYERDPQLRERARERARKAGSTWWDSLTPEQQEAHRERGRQAGKASQSAERK